VRGDVRRSGVRNENPEILGGGEAIHCLDVGGAAGGDRGCRTVSERARLDVVTVDEAAGGIDRHQLVLPVNSGDLHGVKSVRWAVNGVT
jgi:hypothetical protein